ncbi:transcriptional regulator, LysR family [Rhizobium sp. CF080]|uniref:LysR substrate-binding domain-containing protein n=1 Tax=Rhizobium sp. (strain CF080) TaxID=1144310 RepID=UPI000271D5BB|nr:LysR substrate-binding domain-containing protein [Rhizobium sp. CF080]EUB99327.1 transcriptional regulator, LysR family [Rhizobium sp. CF080]
MSLQSVLNLRHLRAFSLTARYNSVKRAAVEICLSQPAVTQAVTKLEKEFKVSFFDRTSTGMFCSEFGRIFLNRVDRALDILARCISEAAADGKSSPPRDPLNLITNAQFRVLTVFSESNNLEFGAEALGISLLSIQRTVMALERSVGTRLFVQSSRSSALTMAGESLVRGAKLAIREIELAADEIENLRGYKTGRIVIGAMPLARVDLVPRAVTALLRTYPDVRVRITEGPYTSLISGLRSGDIDVVVGALRNGSVPNDIEERELFTDPLSIAVRSSHPLCRYDSISLADTIGYPWVVPPMGTPTRTIFHEVFRSRALMEPRRLVEVSSNVSLRAFLVESDRIAFVSRRQIDYEERHGSIKMLPIDLPEASRPIGLALRKHWQPTTAQTELLRLLGEAGDLDRQAPKEQMDPAGVRKTRTGVFPARG